MIPSASAATAVAECPDERLLLQFDRGELSDPAYSSISLHVSSCDRCVETLDQLLSDGEDEADDDPLIACLKQCLRAPQSPMSLEYTALENRAKALEAEAKIRRAAAWDQGLGVDGKPVVGLRIGPYEVLGRVGRGGMGVVYRALQPRLQRTVAIKMILAGHHASDSTVARFMREGKAVARLHHANVVQVYELGEHEGLPYLAMEYVEGGCLEAKLGHEAFEPRDAAALMVILAKAVQYAHNQGVVHRDLKPANVLLAQDGTPKITDFGLAKLLDADPDDNSTVFLTETDTILGTPNYMAPEQAEGRSADIGRATDVYALGAILYALLTGHPPFQEKTKLKTLERVRATPPISPSGLRPEVPYWLEAICLTCLEKSPQRRFPTAQALADDLERWLSDERPQGTPSTITRLTRSTRKNLGKVVCGSALLMAVSGFALKKPDLMAVSGSVPDKSHQAIEQAQRDLASGRAVTLIGKTGGPKWSDWRSEKANGLQELGVDQTWLVSTWNRALVELLPDPQSDSYRINVQVRHEKNGTAGEVGLYFARKTSPFQTSKIEFFTQLTFDDVRTVRSTVLTQMVTKPGMLPVKRPHRVQLFPRLISNSERPDDYDQKLASFPGPEFEPSGELEARWNDLEIVVTPAKITAGWNGRTFSMTPAEVQKGIEFGQQEIENSLTAHPDRVRRTPRGFIPKFELRGGVGLYVRNGAASFRSFTVTPLKTSPLVRETSKEL